MKLRNKKRVKPTAKADPTRLDPTRTTGLRERFAMEIKRRFDLVRDDVLKLVLVDDAFGLSKKQTDPFTVNRSYTYRSTQFNIEDSETLAAIKELQSKIDPADVIKMESEPHITVRYGLHDYPDTPDKVQTLFKETGPVRVKFAGLSAFNQPDQDVLKYAIESQQLVEMHRRLGLLPNTQTYSYNPHLTLAYLKPGTAEKYVGIVDRLFNKELVFTTLKVSDTKGVKEDVTLNTRWAFISSPEKVKLFQQWLSTTILTHLLGENDKTVWTRYVEEGMLKGAGRSFDDFNRRAKNLDKRVDFWDGTRREFLHHAFTQPVAVEKVQLLAQRVFTDLKGVTDVMAVQMSRTLSDGLVQGKSPREVGADLAKNIDGIGKERGALIARTETIRAHAEGQLLAFEQMGVEELGVMAEWSTAKHNVCPLCSVLEGVVLTVEEAKGMIPRHPGCRCAWLPANVGESRTGQKRTKPQIEEAIDASAKLGGKKDTFDSAVPIKAMRPESLVDNVAPCCIPHLDALSAYIVNKAAEKGGLGGPNCGVGPGGFQAGNVCARGGSAGHAADKAKFIGKTVGAAEHAEADHISGRVAKAVGGLTEEHTGGPGQKDKKPYDVRAPKTKNTYHDIEVKSLLKGGKQVLSVHEDALLRKVDHQAANPGNTFHTVAWDRRDTYQGGIHKDSFSGHNIYYKRGSGRYALSKMYKVKDEAELKKLINMPDSKLPAAAKGKLPPPPPISKLREGAAKASESRKARDAVRKARNKDKLRDQARARAAAKKG